MENFQAMEKLIALSIALYNILSYFEIVITLGYTVCIHFFHGLEIFHTQWVKVVIVYNILFISNTKIGQ